MGVLKSLVAKHNDKSNVCNSFLIDQILQISRTNSATILQMLGNYYQITYLEPNTIVMSIWMNYISQEIKISFSYRRIPYKYIK